MADIHQIGDLVWAKLKGFPAWPGKVIEPKPEVKRPKDNKKEYYFVFFFGSENYAWIPEDMIWKYDDAKNRERFIVTTRIPRGFKEACDACEEVLKLLPPKPAMEPEVDEPTLPSIEEEIATIFPAPSSPKKDYTREPFAAKVKSDQLDENSDEAEQGVVPNGDSNDVKPKRDRKPSKKIQESLETIEEVVPPKKKKDDSEKKRKKDSAGSPTTKSKKPKISVPALTSIKARENSAIAGTSTITMTSSSPMKATKTVIATPLKIGFLGLGIMGSGMVTNLLKSGHEVTVWNRTAAKCRDFVDLGALRCNSIAEVIDQCDLTFSCVSDPTAVRDIVFGNCGVLQGISNGKGFIEMSTIDIETVIDINEAISARGGRFLEAPVVGSKEPAMCGDLVILAAGDKELFDDCFSCFEAMGKRSFYLGEVGSGAKLKLVHNVVLGGMMAGLAEGLALAQKVGLDQEDVLKVISLGALNCPLYKTKGKAIAEHEFSTSFPLQHLQKDLRLGIDMGDQVDQPLAVAAAANELFKRAKSMGYGDIDVSAVYRAVDV